MYDRLPKDGLSGSKHVEDIINHHKEVPSGFKHIEDILN